MTGGTRCRGGGEGGLSSDTTKKGTVRPAALVVPSPSLGAAS